MTSRFTGVNRIYGEQAARLRNAHVLVVGLGGVGSWAVEALARSGIGAITLLDGDDVCVTNINRQLIALDSTVGQPKALVTADRIRAINPDCRVTAVCEFFHRTSIDRHLQQPFDYVVDAIDGVSSKMWLLAACRERGLRVIASGGAGSKRDASLVRIVDLGDTFHDPLLAFVRKKLRVRFGFPDRGQPFGIPCVFSPETAPGDGAAPESEEDGRDESAAELFGESSRHNCNTGMGALSFVTGVFGLLAAGYVVNAIAGAAPAEVAAPPPPPRKKK